MIMILQLGVEATATTGQDGEAFAKDKALEACAKRAMTRTTL
jgi:hypothetical protein